MKISHFSVHNKEEIFSNMCSTISPFIITKECLHRMCTEQAAKFVALQ